MGIKRERGKPVLYEELKKKNSFNLTEKAKSVIIREAEKRGITRSELLERLLRSLTDEDFDHLL